MTLIVLDEALEEARVAAEWYDDQRSGLGDDFLVDMEATLDAIVADPQRFPRYEGARVDADVRRAIFRRFSHLAIFQVVEEFVYVLCICHSAQRPAYWKNRVIEP